HGRILLQQRQNFTINLVQCHHAPKKSVSTEERSSRSRRRDQCHNPRVDAIQLRGSFDSQRSASVNQPAALPLPYPHHSPDFATHSGCELSPTVNHTTPIVQSRTKRSRFMSVCLSNE